MSSRCASCRSEMTQRERVAWVCPLRMYLSCGVVNPVEANGTRLVKPKGVMVSLSDEQLQYPLYHISTALSTSRGTLEQMRLMEAMLCHREVPRRYYINDRRYVGYAMRSGRFTECVSARTFVHIRSINFGSLKIIVGYPCPSVGTSTVIADQAIDIDVGVHHRPHNR